MKKSLILGAAAMATMSFMAANTASAGETRIGGYYMFRILDSDRVVGQEPINIDTDKAWVHRLQMNMDFLASKKTHAHLRSRILDTNVVEGVGNNNYDLDANGVNEMPRGRPQNTPGGSAFNVRQMWLETEFAGIGLKVGSMPIELNDGILVNHDEDGYGAIMLSKNLGGVTLVGANVRIDEGDVGNGLGTDGAADGTNRVTAGSDTDDVDLFVLSALGSSAGVNYQLTGAYLMAGSGSEFAHLTTTGVKDTTDSWLALTGTTTVAGVDLTGTLIYESGFSNFANTAATAPTIRQFEGSGFLAALRANGNTGFGGWNGYGYYASKDYTNVSTHGSAGWSDNWDAGGPGAPDLIDTILGANTLMNGAALAGLNSNGVAVENNVTSGTENSMGIGLGLTLKVAGWTVNPTIDYVKVVENDYNNDGIKTLYDGAMAGGVKVSTQIDKGTTFTVSGSVAAPSESDSNSTVTNSVAGQKADDNMHYLQASIKMAF
jgi:hypothetical protein